MGKEVLFMGKSGKRIPFGQRPFSRNLVLLTASTQSGSVTIAPTISSPQHTHSW